MDEEDHAPRDSQGQEVCLQRFDRCRSLTGPPDRVGDGTVRSCNDGLEHDKAESADECPRTGQWRE